MAFAGVSGDVALPRGSPTSHAWDPEADFRHVSYQEHHRIFINHFGSTFSVEIPLRCRLGLEKNQLGLRTPPCATGKAELTAELTREEVTFRVFMILQPMTYSILRD